ncbi:MAG: prepilin-type N-terminal cleavage/methylation domain-containing protein [Candidatus Omnitrophota bacterium]
MILKTGSKAVVSVNIHNCRPGLSPAYNPAAKKGFTLIEVLMAMSLLAIGIVGVLRAYSTSVNAMEIAQYNIDAACLLKAVMGDVEEKAISQRDTPAANSKGVCTPSSDIKMGTSRQGRWQWDKEIMTTSLQAVKTVKKESGTTTGTILETAAEAKTEENPEKIVVYSLDEVKVTVVNPGRSPARRVSAVTYMERESDES